MSKPRKENLGYWEVTAIGIGGMVGGGIFAVLGLSVELTNGHSLVDINLHIPANAILFTVLVAFVAARVQRGVSVK